MTITLGTFEIIIGGFFLILMVTGIIINIRRENDRQMWYERAKREQNKVVIYGDFLKELFTKGKITIDESPHNYKIFLDASIWQMSEEEIKELKSIFSQWADEKLTDVYKDAIQGYISESDQKKLHEIFETKRSKK